MTTRSAVVFAYSSVGYECLSELLESNIRISAVITHKDDPAEERWFRSVYDLAQKNNLPVFTPERLGEKETELIRSLAPDLIFSFSYRQIIPLSILNLASLGAYNIHGALLPKYRGRACINWAIINGETRTGVTLHHMTERADEGRIVDQEATTIEPEDNAHDVFKKMIPLARKILHRSLPSILEGLAPGWAQDESQATYFGRRHPEDGLIQWTQSAKAIHNLVRAVTHPFPGAYTELNSEKLFIWKTRVHLPQNHTSPGVVICSSPLLVSTGDGTIEILRGQWRDREEMEGAELKLSPSSRFSKGQS